MVKVKYNLVGQKFGDWEVLEYLGRSTWRCRCSCGAEKNILTGKLTAGQTMSCGHNKLIDLTGRRFGEWDVLEYAGNMYWKCKCSCGNIRNVQGKHLRDGTSTSCGHNGSSRRIDLTGKQFGEYKVLGYVGEKYWRCKCSCGKIKDIHGARLRNGEARSCGHTNKLTDLIGKRFGKLKVIEYIGDRKYRCRCECGKYTEVMTCNLLNNSTQSCGCLTETIYTKEKILYEIDDYIKEYGYKPFKVNIADRFGISLPYMHYLIRKYNIPSNIFNEQFGSYMEKEVYEFIKDNTDKTIYLHNRCVLKNAELDIYIPELSIAFEINGDYWHSSKIRGKNYHQQKTIRCAKAGIQLIHIFEHEWKMDKSRDKIKTLIKSRINTHKHALYTDEVVITKIDSHTEESFIRQNSLCNYKQSSMAYGAFKNGELIGVVSFKILNNKSGSEYELLNYCAKQEFNNVDILNYLFKAFMEESKPKTVVTHIDISKFTGDIYIGIGFRSSVDMITPPNHIWVRQNFGTEDDIYTCDSIELHKLLENTCGEYGSTEDEIMYSLGFMKIYDSGHLKLIYNT